ncbi:MAG: uncharacterized protein KVP18_004223 [Porospora cf. gigantea A]|uniref:uncharacterized protein n=1 Tax=Porospora cf. gigantea A TaxID=2853593 RepID=UPI00355A436C|nr:MAG: hypothetical protein KVP18_004223 [Porospora cf. gigantea A]
MNLETVDQDGSANLALVASISANGTLRIPRPDPTDITSQTYLKIFDMDAIDNAALYTDCVNTQCIDVETRPATCEATQLGAEMRPKKHIPVIDEFDEPVDFELPSNARLGVVDRNHRVIRVESPVLDSNTKDPLATADIQMHRIQEDRVAKDFVDVPVDIPRIQLEKAPEKGFPPAFHTMLAEPGPERTANTNAGSSVLHVADNKYSGLNGAFGIHMMKNGLKIDVYKKIHEDIWKDLEVSVEDVVLKKTFPLDAKKRCPPVLEASAIAPIDPKTSSGFCCLSILQDPKSLHPAVAPEYAMLYVVGPNGKRGISLQDYMLELKLLGVNMARLIETHNSVSEYPVDCVRVPLISGSIYRHEGVPIKETYKIALAMLEGIAEYGSNVQWSFVDKDGVFSEAGEHLFQAGKHV